MVGSHSNHFRILFILPFYVFFVKAAFHFLPIKYYNYRHMDDKKAAEILINLLKKYSLTKGEKEAVESAIGILSWTTLSKSRIKKMKDKKEKSIKW